MKPDLRVLALDVAGELERLAGLFPNGEPGRKWLRLTARRLKNGYARTRGQQKKMILRSIENGNRRIADFVDGLGFSRREVVSMLRDLVRDGYVVERTVSPEGSKGGRPGQWFELTHKAEVVLGF